MYRKLSPCKAREYDWFEVVVPVFYGIFCFHFSDVIIHKFLTKPSNFIDKFFQSVRAIF